MAVLDFHCCSGFSLSCVSESYSLVAVHEASHCGGLSCCRAWAIGQVSLVARLLGSWNLPRLNSRGAQAWLLRGLWDLPQVRDWTCLLNWLEQLLQHWTTREVPHGGFSVHFSKMLSIMSLFAVCVYSLVKVSSFPYFYIEWFVFLLSCRVPYWIPVLQKIFLLLSDYKIHFP